MSRESPDPIALPNQAPNLRRKRGIRYLTPGSTDMESSSSDSSTTIRGCNNSPADSSSDFDSSSTNTSTSTSSSTGSESSDTTSVPACEDGMGGIEERREKKNEGQVNSMSSFIYPGSGCGTGVVGSDQFGVPEFDPRESLRRALRRNRQRARRCPYGSRRRRRREGSLESDYRNRRNGGNGGREAPIFNFVTQNQNVFNGDVRTGEGGGWMVRGGL